METIRISEVKTSVTQRRIRPWKVAHISDKMRSQGYNESYPITLDTNGVLVDGGHRIAAAKEAGIESVPFIVTDDDPVKHAVRCNADGADTEPHDVFDLAELCYALSNEGMTGQEIADRILGWTSPSIVTLHKQIKEKLHKQCFELASCGQFTKNGTFANQTSDSLVNLDFTIVKFTESHLRALISELPAEDNATYRAQLTVIRLALSDKKMTAKKIKAWAIREAWYRELALMLRDRLDIEVPLSARVSLLRSIKNGVFGAQPSDDGRSKMNTALAALNEKATGIKLYHDDALQRIPLLEDKSIALMVTDWPYNTTDNEWDKFDSSGAYLQFLRDFMDVLRPKLADNYHLYIFCSQHYAARIELEVFSEWPVQSRIIWIHRNMATKKTAKNGYSETWDMCFHIGNHPLNMPPEWTDEGFDTQTFATPQANFKDDVGNHPTPKPRALFERFIRHGSAPGDTILDPFAGGGTTGHASKEVGQRKCILIEREDGYCKATEDRLGIQRVTEVV